MAAPEVEGGGLGRGWRGVGGALRKKLKTRALRGEDEGLWRGGCRRLRIRMLSRCGEKAACGMEKK